MSFVCELSGEPLTGTAPVVVTPSGHVCLKRLLLTKLAENGGVDPWSTGPLQESQLVELAASNKVLPPRPQITSLPNLMELMQREYDNLVLELFDTRQALEDTRKELSQALYQNDAAVRVVARISIERDQARQELEQWSAAAAMQMATGAVADGDAATEPPPSKKQRTSVEANEHADVDAAQESPDSANTTTATKATTGIPADQLVILTNTWEQLSQERKAQKKELGLAAPTKERMATMTERNHKGWHKSSGKQGLFNMAQHDTLLVTTARDKQLCAYDIEKGVLSFSIANVGATTNSLDLQGTKVMVGVNQNAILFDKENQVATLDVASDVVHLQFHPSGLHVVVLAKDSRLILCDANLQKIASFGEGCSYNYTAGQLHPDGLLYAAGTESGHVQLWDFKSGGLATTMKSESDDSAIVHLTFSSSGYHVASVTMAGKVHVWDLKKQKCMAVLEDIVAKTACFDVSGKYLSYGGEKGVVITALKEWGVVAQVTTKKTSGIVWSRDSLITCSDKERSVRFHECDGEDGKNTE